MNQSPGGSEQDRLNEIVRGLNQGGNNGYVPTVNVKQRPSGFKCPKCGTMAAQNVQPAPGTVLGYKFHQIRDDMPDQTDDDRPSPVAVITHEIIDRDSDGNATRVYRTMHCMECFNAWQRRKMMEEIRANVPQLEYVGVDDA